MAQALREASLRLTLPRKATCRAGALCPGSGTGQRALQIPCHHQSLCKHRWTPLAGTRLTSFLSSPASEQFTRTAKGKASGLQFTQAVFEAKTRGRWKAPAPPTEQPGRLARPLESTSCPNKPKRQETSGLGKQFKVSQDVMVSENTKVICKRIKRHLTLRSNERWDKNSFISDNKCFWDTWCV